MSVLRARRPDAKESLRARSFAHIQACKRAPNTRGSAGLKFNVAGQER
jgi:hypothetical protein